LRDRELPLADGRRLAYAEFGAAGGLPVMYFHGSPSSRLEPLLVGDEAWAGQGLRVVAFDRPGIGSSTDRGALGFLAGARDALALADALGWSRFALLGNSGGAPYVAAAATLFAERVSNAVIVSGGWRMDWPEARNGLPFVNRLVMTLARWAPWLLRGLLAGMGRVGTGDPARELAQLSARVPAPDAAAFAAPGRLAAFAATMQETVRQGTRGAARDLGLYVRQFDFESSAVRVPIVWFHGVLDTNSPIALARRAVASLPGATLVEFEAEAHLSTLCQQLDAYAPRLRDG
jgi:pimeloyl-ACP methyl ester carboxylesterase